MLKRKPMVPGGRQIIAIGYKYNAWKVLYFIVTENEGRTQTCINYLSKYPEQFSNIAIHPVAFTLVMYRFFESVNEVNYHNKPSQSDLAL